MVGREIVMAVLCLTSLDPYHLQLAVYTASPAFPDGGAEQPRQGVGVVWLSQRWITSGDLRREAIATEQQERAAAAKWLPAVYGGGYRTKDRQPVSSQIPSADSWLLSGEAPAL